MGSTLSMYSFMLCLFRPLLVLSSACTTGLSNSWSTSTFQMSLSASTSKDALTLLLIPQVTTSEISSARMPMQYRWDSTSPLGSLTRLQACQVAACTSLSRSCWESKYRSWSSAPCASGSHACLLMCAKPTAMAIRSGRETPVVPTLL